MTIRTLLLAFLFFCCPLTALAEDDEARARRLINGLGCKACHSFEQSGSTLAPPLDRIGSRLTPEQITEKIVTYRGEETKPFMPSYATTPQEELNTLIQFLAQQQ